MPTEIQSHQTLMKDRVPSPNVTKNPFLLANDNTAEIIYKALLSRKCPDDQLFHRRTVVRQPRTLLSCYIRYTVNIPRQSWGLYDVSRSKRLERGR
jgi:hypothetical protein